MKKTTYRIITGLCAMVGSVALTGYADDAAVPPWARSGATITKSDWPFTTTVAVPSSGNAPASKLPNVGTFLPTMTFGARGQGAQGWVNQNSVTFGTAQGIIDPGQYAASPEAGYMTANIPIPVPGQTLNAKYMWVWVQVTHPKSSSIYRDWPTTELSYTGGTGTASLVDTNIVPIPSKPTGNAGDWYDSVYVYKFDAPFPTSFNLKLKSTQVGVAIDNVIIDAKMLTTTYPAPITDIPLGIVEEVDPGMPSKVINWTVAPVSTTCTPPSGSQFSIGKTRVKCVNKDSVGLGPTAYFIVEIVNPVPVITSCAGDHTLVLGNNCSLLMPDYRGQVIAVDPKNPGPIDPANIIQDPAPDSPVGASGPITFTVVNAWGPSEPCVAQLTFVANPPVLPASIPMGAKINTKQVMDIDKLLAATSNPDGRALTVVLLGAASGALTEVVGNTIEYTPLQDSVDPDIIYFTVDDCSGISVLSQIDVTISPSSESMNIIAVHPSSPGGPATIEAQGIPGFSYMLERAPSANGPWEEVGGSLAIAGPDGSLVLTDPASLDPVSLYRTKYVP
jgi:hypothetical protein